MILKSGGHDSLDRGPGRLVGVRPQVPVGVQRRLRRGVAETMLDHLHIRPRRDQHRGVVVPKPVPESGPDRRLHSHVRTPGTRTAHRRPRPDTRCGTAGPARTGGRCRLSGALSTRRPPGGGEDQVPVDRLGGVAAVARTGRLHPSRALGPRNGHHTHSGPVAVRADHLIPTSLGRRDGLSGTVGMRAWLVYEVALSCSKSLAASVMRSLATGPYIACRA